MRPGVLHHVSWFELPRGTPGEPLEIAILQRLLRDEKAQVDRPKKHLDRLDRVDVGDAMPRR